MLSAACAEIPGTEAAAGFEKPISFSILEDYDKGEDLTQVQADFVLFNELGISTWRGSFGWDDYEPQRGVYDFAWLHQFADLAARHGIALRPYIGYTPSWAGKPRREDGADWNNPPARLEDWYRFVFRLASAMKGHPNVLSYEIYNEENSPSWWDGSAQEYAQVLTQGSNAVRRAQGDDQVLLGGITYPDTAWMAAVCTGSGNGETFDILPLHAYPETWPVGLAVENYLDQNSPGSFHGTFLPEVGEKCGIKPIWINETGFATTPGRKTERDQANWWARAIATFAADPRIEHIGVYEIKDRPREADVIGEPENHYLGLSYPDRKKKLAFFTVKRLVELLNTGTIDVADGALSVASTSGRPGALYHHYFIRPDGRQVLLVWDKTASPVLRITLSNPGSRAFEYALDGTAAIFPDFEGRTLHDVRLVAGEVRIFEVVP